MKQLLIKLNACQEALEWAGDKSWKEIYTTCSRGDWLLWLHYHTNQEDLQVRTLAKGHCANTIRHLMKDERSLNAVDTAIAFGEGKATREELIAASRSARDTASASASAAYAAAYAASAYAASAYAAAAAADAAALSAAYAAHAYAAADAAYAARAIAAAAAAVAAASCD